MVNTFAIKTVFLFRITSIGYRFRSEITGSERYLFVCLVFRVIILLKGNFDEIHFYIKKILETRVFLDFVRDE